MKKRVWYAKVPNPSIECTIYSAQNPRYVLSVDAKGAVIGNG